MPHAFKNQPWTAWISERERGLLRRRHEEDRSAQVGFAQVSPSAQLLLCFCSISKCIAWLTFAGSSITIVRLCLWVDNRRRAS